MLFRLAWATLSRHRARTLLATLGVAVSAAMLLDMVMLSSGMRASLQDLLLSRGFQLRLAPKGTLPFDTVAMISPVLGGQLHVEAGERTVTSTALGVDPTVQGDYEITSGRAPSSANEL